MKGIFHHEGVTYKAVFFPLPLYIINVGAYLIFLKKVWCENKKKIGHFDDLPVYYYRISWSGNIYTWGF